MRDNMRIITLDNTLDNTRDITSDNTWDGTWDSTWGNTWHYTRANEQCTLLWTTYFLRDIQ